MIDIRSLIPLDKEAIFESVKKTSKALVVHEDKVFSGFGAELAAMIGTDMFRYLDGPVQRVDLHLLLSVSIRFWKKRYCRMRRRSMRQLKSYWNINGIKWRYSI